MNSITEDKRYLKFVERYSGDLPRFAVEVLGADMLSVQQLELLTHVQVSRSRVSVSSGHSCFAKGTSIMLESGECVPVEDVKAGDKLMGADGNSSRTVLELRRGVDKLYKFTYHDNTSHTFNENHILCLIATNSKGRRKAGEKTTVTVSEWLKWGEDKKRCHAIYRSKVTDFKRQTSDLVIPPYIMGVWLGDGTSSLAHITTGDEEIKNAFRDFAESVDCDYKEKYNSENSIVAMAVKKSGWTNNALQLLKQLNVFRNKHIPKDYLYASLNDRLELLAGLIDSDGYKDGFSYSFTNKDGQLAHQVMWLARSIGVHATIKSAVKKCTNNGVSGSYWRVTIGRNADIIPVRIDRKKQKADRTRRIGLNFGIKSCEPLGEGDYYGFLLDGDHKFLGGDFTVLHNTGKTFSISAIVLWHLICFPNSITLITANDLAQIKNTVFKEIATRVEGIARSNYAWIYPHIEVLASSMVRIKGHEKNWFVASKTAQAKNANKIAGFHARWLMIIADEASSIADEVFKTLYGALSEEHNRMLMTSQPTRNAGEFWRTHNELSVNQGGDWLPLVFSSFDSPWASDEFLRQMWSEYDDDERAVRLLGEFPQDSSKVMMSLADSNSMYKRGRIIQDHEPYGWAVLMDVASGEGLRDKSAVVLARVIGYGDRGEEARRVEIVKIPLLTNTIRANKLADYVVEECSGYSNLTYVIDAGGLGVNVCQDVEDKNQTVHRVLWGKPCFKRKNSERYLNIRAQAMHQAARAVKEGRLSILTYDYQRVMVGQSSRIPKEFTDAGKIRVPPKGSTAWEGLGSPDLWDAVTFCFSDDFSYLPADNNEFKTELTATDNALATASDMFADLEFE